MGSSEAEAFLKRISGDEEECGATSAAPAAEEAAHGAAVTEAVDCSMAVEAQRASGQNSARCGTEGKEPALTPAPSSSPVLGMPSSTNRLAPLAGAKTPDFTKQFSKSDI